MSGFGAGVLVLLREIRSVIERQPWILLLAAIGEGAQHAVEARFGMYTLGDGLQPGWETNVRLMFGVAKAVAVLGAALLAARYLRETSPPPSGRPDRLALLLVCIAPLYALHVVANRTALYAGRPVAALVLVGDCMIVALIAVAIGAVMAARRVAR